MKYASIERCPVYGGKVKSYDPKDALSVGGVERVVEIPATPMPSGFKPLGGIAVIANNTWSAQQGRQRLKIEWDYGPNAGHDSAVYRARDRGDSEGARQGSCATMAMSTVRWRQPPSEYQPTILSHIWRMLKWKCLPPWRTGYPIPARRGRRRKTPPRYAKPSLRSSASTNPTSPSM